MGHVILVSFATDGNLNQALAKGLKQLFVAGVVAIVTWRTASKQGRNHGDRGCTLKIRVAPIHPPMMPPIVARTKILKQLTVSYSRRYNYYILLTRAESTSRSRLANQNQENC
jgi:hypothetical protein